ncbi:Heterokaryon incompatibility protein 6 OR allele, partial [Lachnellula suecica]
LPSPLANLPPFETLSYCWGTSPLSLPITVDSQTLHIKPNLASALREFRRSHREALEQRTLWIDAICINQEDVEERNQQVGYMCRIYSLSTDLVVWLGDADEFSEIALSFIRPFARLAGAKAGKKIFDDWAERLSCTPLLPVIFHALNQFLNRPWFRRAWVLQEYILGGVESTVFQCGKEQVSGKEMEVLCNLMSRGKLTKLARRCGVAYTGGRWQEIFEAKEHHRRTKTEGDAFSILQWLLQARYAEATNSRDKVYAVYGLFEAEQWSGYDPKAFLVDYNASVQDVFSSLVKTLVVSSKKLNVLMACGNRTSLVQRTWTPDWTIRSPDLQFIGRYRCEVKKLRFHAAGDSDAVATFSDNLSTLTLRGLIWDTITAISPPPTEPDFKDFCKETWDAIDANGTYASEHDTSVFLNQTLGSRNEELFKSNLDTRLKDSFAQKAQAFREKNPGRVPRLNRSAKAQALMQKLTTSMTNLPKRWAPNERVVVTERAFVGKDYAQE